MTITRKRYGGKRSRPNLRYQTGIRPDVLKKKHEKTISIAGLQAKIRTHDLPNKKQKG
jgi:hypothetical protein